MSSADNAPAAAGGRPCSRVRADAGFTLIELMISVAIIGVLASAAVTPLQKYMQQARDVEAIESSAKIAEGASMYYQATGHLPVSKMDEATYTTGYKYGHAYGPSWWYLCQHGGRATASDIDLYFRQFAPWYVWDKLQFGAGVGTRFSYWYWGYSNIGAGSNYAYAWIDAYRSIDCSGNGGTWVYYRSTLRMQDGALRRFGPRIERH